VTHTMPQVFRVCSEVMLLSHGRVKYQGRDVATGVAKYFDEFGGGEQTVTGSGEAVVKGLTATAGETTGGLFQSLEIPFGSELTVELQLQLTGGYRNGRVLER
jgi:ABC-type multidrug transport system ATPase subunit